jgi:hypothetical protein
MTELDAWSWRFIPVKGKRLDIDLFGNEVTARPGNRQPNI